MYFLVITGVPILLQFLEKVFVNRLSNDEYSIYVKSYNVSINIQYVNDERM